MSFMEQFLDDINSAIEEGTTTVAKLANACGCSRQHIYNVLSGTREVTMRLGLIIAKECNVEISKKKGRKKVTN